MGRGLTGINPLKYRGVRPGTPPNMVIFKRRPTIKDYIEYEIGDLWVIPKRAPDAPTTDPSKEVWILVSKRYQQGIWIRFRFGGNTPTGAGYIITEYNTPGATGNHTLDEQTQLVEIHAWGAGNSGAGGGLEYMGTGFSGGGGGGGYLHWLIPASTFGGGGTAVSYSVADETPGGAAENYGQWGDPTIFGALKTPISSSKIYADNFGTTIIDNGAGLRPSQAMGNGMIDNGNVMDPAALFLNATLSASDLTQPAQYNSPWSVSAHCGIGGLFFVDVANATFYTNLITGHPYLPAGGGINALGYYNGCSVGNTYQDIFAQGGVYVAGAGVNGANGGNANGFYIAGAGGSSAAAGVGGNGGWPGGGGGSGGGSNPGPYFAGGKGAGGRLIVIEYLG